MTLNGVIGPVLCVITPNSGAVGAYYVGLKVVEDTPTHSASEI